jgi:hypothetical protein
VKETRIKIADGVFLTYLPMRKFKTGLLSAQFMTPLEQGTVAVNALLPAILRRGTVRFSRYEKPFHRIGSALWHGN